MNPSAAAACVALALGTLPASPASAQTRAALVQDVDEPSRHAYWDNADTRNFDGACTGNYCVATYPAVPAGIRRVIENVSCVAVQGADPILYLELNTQSPYTRTRLYFGAAPNVAGSNQLFANLRTLAYFSAGDQPAVFAYTQSSNGPIALKCTLAGHDVAVP